MVELLQGEALTSNKIQHSKRKRPVKSMCLFLVFSLSPALFLYTWIVSLIYYCPMIQRFSLLTCFMG